MSTARQYYKDLLSTAPYPCIAACEWADQFPDAGKIQLVQNAKQPWQAWVAEYSRDVELLELLANSYSWVVRYEVAINGYTPMEVLERLTLDDDEDIRSAANANIYSRTH